MNTINGKVFYTIDEVAKKLKLTYANTYNAIRTGKLVSERFANSYFISEESLEDFKENYLIKRNAVKSRIVCK